MLIDFKRLLSDYCVLLFQFTLIHFQQFFHIIRISNSLSLPFNWPYPITQYFSSYPLFPCVWLGFLGPLLWSLPHKCLQLYYPFIFPLYLHGKSPPDFTQPPAISMPVPEEQNRLETIATVEMIYFSLPQVWIRNSIFILLCAPVPKRYWFLFIYFFCRYLTFPANPTICPWCAYFSTPSQTVSLNLSCTLESSGELFKILMPRLYPIPMK